MTIKNKLQKIVIDSDTLSGKRFDIFIQICIIISLISFSIETLNNLSESTINILKFIELITVSIFTIEYFLRVVLTKNKLSYVFSFFGIVDLLAILPFYLSSGIDLRSILSQKKFLFSSTEILSLVIKNSLFFITKVF